MQEIETFSTERLIAKRLTQEHFPELRLLWQDPRGMGPAGVRSDENIHIRMRQSIGHWETHGFGRWLSWGRERGEFVGMCNLRHIVVEGTPEVDLGYAVRFEFRGKGFATEMTKAVLLLSFGLVGLNNVIALIDPVNTPSRRVAEKAGLKYEREAVFQGGKMLLYRIRAKQ
jgi:RimJ/RimL family protein N-acetyltransferase